MTADTNDPSLAPGELPPAPRLSVTDARAVVEAGQGVLVDTRDRRLYDNAHAANAVSLPLSEIEAAHGQVRLDSVPPDRVLILYCA